MSDMPKFVQLNEEGPREGFQIEKGPIPTERKVELIDALSETGLSQIQVVSFVNPARVPGMADAGEVVQRFKRKPGIRYTGLWLNSKGLQRAIATGVLDIKGSLSLTASAKFLARNQQRSMEENAAAQHDLIRLYKENNVPIERASIMAAFGCNFEGDIPHERVLGLIRTIFDLAEEHGLTIKLISLADTMAWATPLSIKRLVGAVREQVSRPAARAAPARHARIGLRQRLCGIGDGRRRIRQHRRRPRRLPVRGAPRCRGQCLHRGSCVHAAGDGHRDRREPRKADRGRAMAEEIVGHPLPGSVKMGGSLKPLRAAAAH